MYQLWELKSVPQFLRTSMILKKDNGRHDCGECGKLHGSFPSICGEVSIMTYPQMRHYPQSIPFLGNFLIPFLKSMVIKLTSFESVTVPLYIDDPAMMKESVEDRGSDDRIFKQLLPVKETFIRR